MPFNKMTYNAYNVFLKNTNATSFLNLESQTPSQLIKISLKLLRKSLNRIDHTTYSLETHLK